ncbi:MAG TPA: hypothetical protein VJ184_04435, partial [Chryseolinea sp.]|nr:hypothetical protein [Chryseolinea sp.]
EKISADTFYINGNLPRKTATITINGKKLIDYQSNSTMLKYLTNTHIGNLKEGANKYLIAALDDNTDIFAAITLSLIYADGELTIENESNADDIANNPLLNLEKPKNNQNKAINIMEAREIFTNNKDVLISHPSDEQYILRGKTYPFTQYIKVNGNLLEDFDPVSETWGYVVYKERDNLKNGTNTFIIEFFTEAGKLVHTEETEIVYP